MKHLILLLLLFTLSKTIAQINLNDFGRITINSYLSDKLDLPSEAKNILLSKLDEITSSNGIGGNLINPRFLITTNVILTSKDIISGPPQMIAQNLLVTFFIGDAITNSIYSNTSLSLKGVGINENKAFIDAINNINTKDKKIEILITDAINKISKFYSSQCESFLTQAQNLKESQKFDEGIYLLSQIPEICLDCFSIADKELSNLYNAKINHESFMYLLKAKSIWSLKPNDEGADDAIEFLTLINPNADCYSDAKKLINTIYHKLISDQKTRTAREEEFYKQQQLIEHENTKSALELEKFRIQTYLKIAIEYAKKQDVNLYKNIFWN
jgi:hypothetical protein